MRKISRYLEGFNFWGDMKTLWDIVIWLRDTANKELPMLAATSENVRVAHKAVGGEIQLEGCSCISRAISVIWFGGFIIVLSIWEPSDFVNIKSSGIEHSATG